MSLEHRLTVIRTCRMVMAFIVMLMVFTIYKHKVIAVYIECVPTVSI